MGRRRFAGAGLYRRGGRFRGGGVVYLLDYNDATFTRSSIAAWQDPRNGWAFTKSLQLNTAEAGNVVTAPDDFSDAAWVETGTSVVATNTSVAPDGTTTADALTDDDASSAEQIAQTCTVVSSTKYAFSLWMEQDGAATHQPRISVSGMGGTYTFLWDPTDGRITIVSGAGILEQWHAEEVIAGWYRCVFIATASTTSSTITIKPANQGSLADTGTTSFWRCTMFPVGTESPTPYATVDEPRIFSDQAILIETAGTNDLPESRDIDAGAWGALSTVTAGESDGPDSRTASGDRVETASAGVGRFDVTGSTTKGAASVFVKKPSAGTGDYTLYNYLNASDGSMVAGTAGTDWGRVSVVHGGTTGTRTVILNDGRGTGTFSFASEGAAAKDCLYDMAQHEPGVGYASSFIPTDGASGTRAAEEYQFSAADWAALKAANKFYFPLWLNWASTDTPAAGTIRTLFDTDGTSFIYFRYTGAAWELRFANSAGTSVESLGISWAVGDELKVHVDHTAGTVTLENVTQSTIDTATATTAAGGSFDGTNAAVGSNTVATQQVDGVVGRPVLA